MLSFISGRGKQNQVTPLKHHGLIEPLVKGKYTPVNPSDEAAMSAWKNNNSKAIPLAIKQTIELSVPTLVARNPQEQDEYDYLEDLEKDQIKAEKCALTKKQLEDKKSAMRVVHAQDNVIRVLKSAEELMTGALSFIEFIDIYEKSAVAPYFDKIEHLNKTLTHIIAHVLSTPNDLLDSRNSHIAEQYALETERKSLHRAFEAGWMQGLDKRNPSRLDAAKTNLMGDARALLAQGVATTRDDSHFNRALLYYENQARDKPDPNLTSLIERLKKYINSEKDLVEKLKSPAVVSHTNQNKL